MIKKILLLVYIAFGVALAFYIRDQYFSDKYEQNVKVDYVIYTPAKELHRSKVIKINGNNLGPFYHASRGINKVYIIDKNDGYGIFNHRPCINLYDGTDYCEVVKITPLKNSTGI